MSNEKQRSQIGMAMGILILFLGVLITPIGIIGLLNMTWDYIGLLILVFALSGVLLLVSGFNMIQTARDQIKKHKGIQASIAVAAKSETIPSTVNGVPVKASWEIDETTWAQFHKNEIHYRNEDNIYFFIACMIIGTISIMVFRASNFLTAFIISAVVGLIIVFLRRRLALAKLDTKAQKKQVVITDYMVVLNNQEYVLFSEDRQARKIKLIKNSTPIILEYTIYWPTRNGETFDELRIPVPPYAVEYAEDLVRNFKS